MTPRLLALPLAGAAFLLAFAAFAKPAQEPADDPLPKGATMRFGVSRPILRNGPAVALLPPKYTTFLAPTQSGGVRRYDLATGKPIDKKSIVSQGAVIVSPDGKRAAHVRPATLIVVDTTNDNQILIGVRPPDGVSIAAVAPGVSFSTDGKLMAYSGKGQDGKGEVVVMDVDKDEVIAQVQTNQLAPVYPVLSGDGKLLITHGPPAPAPTVAGTAAPAKPKLPEGVDPREAQVWEVANSQEMFKARVTGAGGNVVTAAFSPKADFIAVAAADGPIELFDVKTGKRRTTLLGGRGQGVRVAISPDGKTIASVGMDYRIERWQADGTPIGFTDAPPGMIAAAITGLVFADKERVIAWMTANQFAYGWDAPAGKLLSPAMDHAHAIRTIAFPEGGKDLLTSGSEGKSFRWDLADGSLQEEIAFKPARIPGQPLLRATVNISADGKLALWPRSPIVEVFNVETGENLYTIPPPSGTTPSFVSITTSPDGLRVATVCKQEEGKRFGSCVVWDLPTRKRVAEVETPAVAAGTPGTSFSADGTKIAIAAFVNNDEGGQTLTVVVHDLKTGKKLGEVEDPSARGQVTLVLANNTTLLATSANGRIWTMDFTNGQVGEDIENIPNKGEAPIHGPVLFSPDGKRFATGVVGAPFTTYGVRLYDLASRKAVHTFVGHLGPVSAIRFSPDGNTLATGAQDTSVLLWDLAKIAKEK